MQRRLKTKKERRTQNSTQLLFFPCHRRTITQSQGMSFLLSDEHTSFGAAVHFGCSTAHLVEYCSVHIAKCMVAMVTEPRYGGTLDEHKWMVECY